MNRGANLISSLNAHSFWDITFPYPGALLPSLPTFLHTCCTQKALPNLLWPTYYPGPKRNMVLLSVGVPAGSLGQTGCLDSVVFLPDHHTWLLVCSWLVKPSLPLAQSFAGGKHSPLFRGDNSPPLGQAWSFWPVFFYHSCLLWTAPQALQSSRSSLAHSLASMNFSLGVLFNINLVTFAFELPRCTSNTVTRHCTHTTLCKIF